LKSNTSLDNVDNVSADMETAYLSLIDFSKLSGSRRLKG